MAVWTVSWQEGSGGDEVARLLAERAEVPLVDREAVTAIARRFGWTTEQASEYERHLPGPLNRLALSLGMGMWASGAVVEELDRPKTLAEAVELVYKQAARWPCVLLGRAGFAILADHPGCVHVRIRAPLTWRIERVARLEYVSRAEARERILADDRKRAAYVKLLYSADIDDPSHFDLICDASRFSQDALVELLLLAGRRTRFSSDDHLPSGHDERVLKAL
jgi:cytidylate kinase